MEVLLFLWQRNKAVIWRKSHVKFLKRVCPVKKITKYLNRSLVSSIGQTIASNREYLHFHLIITKSRKDLITELK